MAGDPDGAPAALAPQEADSIPRFERLSGTGDAEDGAFRVAGDAVLRAGDDVRGRRDEDPASRVMPPHRGRGHGEEVRRAHSGEEQRAVPDEPVDSLERAIGPEQAVERAPPDVGLGTDLPEEVIFQGPASIPRGIRFPEPAFREQGPELTDGLIAPVEQEAQPKAQTPHVIQSIGMSALILKSGTQ